jgi:hypothetical protein
MRRQESGEARSPRSNSLPGRILGTFRWIASSTDATTPVTPGVPVPLWCAAWKFSSESRLSSGL